jgi:ribosomal protein S18 acetylase RimI-like enzyme
MLTLRPYDDTLFDPVVDFLTRLNDDPAHHIGFFGYGRDDIAQTLRDHALPLSTTFFLAERDDRLAGVFGVDHDAEVSQAWLYGPMVDDPAWDATADALYDQARALIPPGIERWNLFADAGNVRLAAFAARHGYEAGDANTIMTLSRGDEPGSLSPAAELFDVRYAGQLAAAHEALFPNTYYTASQLMNWEGEDGRLIVRADGGELLGYAFYRLQPAAGQSYLDFIGTVEGAQRRGVGRGLLAAVVSDSFSDSRIGRINLTVRAGNGGAIALYESFGFRTERTLRSYRRSVEPVRS